MLILIREFPLAYQFLIKAMCLFWETCEIARLHRLHVRISAVCRLNDAQRTTQRRAHSSGFVLRSFPITRNAISAIPKSR